MYKIEQLHREKLWTEAKKYDNADDFIEWYKSERVEVFVDNIENIHNIQLLHHNLNAYNVDRFYSTWWAWFGVYKEMLDRLMNTLNRMDIFLEEWVCYKIRRIIDLLDIDNYTETCIEWTEIKEKINDIIEEYLDRIEEKYVWEGLVWYSDEVETLRARSGSFSPSGQQRARSILYDVNIDDSILREIREEENDWTDRE